MPEQIDYSQVRKTALKALGSLGRLPATSYYEHAGALYVAKKCEDLGLDVQIDHWGNVLASRHGTEPDAPGLAFVAHLDHPGFIAIAEQGDHVIARVVGGVPPQADLGGAPVFAVVRDVDADDPRDTRVERVAGVIVGPAEGTEERSVIMRFERPVEALPAPVVFDLPDFDLDASRITMRAADDLAGCASILAALEVAARLDSPGTVYGLFTRAEEVGLIGSRLAAEEHLLPRNTVVVSVETSLALPGATHGDGPVIRTGDRSTTFDNAAEAYLVSAAAAIRERAPEFKSQRQLMGAGGCEASAFSAFGYSVTGLAYPLGNWHNNGPDQTIAAEYISLEDFGNGAMLLAEAATRAGTAPSAASTTRLREPVGARERNRLLNFDQNY